MFIEDLQGTGSVTPLSVFFYLESIPINSPEIYPYTWLELVTWLLPGVFKATEMIVVIGFSQSCFMPRDGHTLPQEYLRHS